MSSLTVNFPGPFVSRMAAMFTLLVCSVVIVGWIFDIAILRNFLPGLVSMKFNSAIALSCCGVALWLKHENTQLLRFRSSQVCALTAILIGLITLLEYELDWYGIDELVFADPEGIAQGLAPGRPLRNTALAICFIGSALLLFDSKTRHGHLLAQWLALAAGFIAFISLLGYSYNIQSTLFFTYYSLSLGATFSIIALAVGTLWARPDYGFMAIITSDNVAGLMARRLLPAIFLIPPLLGSLRILGERAGYYNAIFGLALFDTITILIFAILVFINIRALNNSDIKRQKVEQTLLGTNQELEARVARRTEDLQQTNKALAAEIRERQQTEDKFRQFIEFAPNAMVIVDREGQIKLVNAQTEKLFDYTRDELLGQTVEILIPDSLHAQHRKHRQNYITSPQSRPMNKGIKAEAKRKDGSTFPVEISLECIQSNEGVLVTGIIQDVTLREQAEQARFIIQERYRSLVNNLPIGVYRSTIEHEAHFIEINPAMIGMLDGDSSETLINSPVYRFCEDTHEYARIHDKIMRMGVIKNEELKLITCKGRKFWGAITAILVKDKNGCAYFDGIIEDISERKEIEQHIHALNKTLIERATELEAINMELEAFSYSVSHDLRTPLRAIDGFSGILLHDYSNILDVHGRDCLQRVRRAAQHMGALIDDLLNLSRVSRTELIHEEVDMSTLAHEIAENLRKQSPDRQVNLEIYSGLKVRGDPRLLLIALDNLLGNAWKFTCHQQDAHIEFGMNTQHIFYIRDNGAGFNMAYSNKLFGAFQRLHNTNEFPGTGIGLATVQRIVRKHGGRIWAEGAVGQGATFYFNFKQENTQ